MTGQEFILLFEKNKAYLLQDTPLTFEQVGIWGFVRSFPTPAYLKFRVLNYYEGEQRLAGEIITYNVGYASFSPAQQACAEKLKLVRSVSFRDINTPSVFRMLSATKPISFTPLHETPVYRPEPRTSIPSRVNFSATFNIPIKKVSFKNGKVVVSGKFEAYGKIVELTIPNEDVIEEYDAIKDYFGNVLNTKKIRVNARIEVSNNEVVSKTASSDDIDRINKQLIEVVKFEFLKSAKKNTKNEVDKSIFTVEEFLETFGAENFKNDVFYKDENELVEDLMKISDTKHYQHLRFLSSKHRHEVMKLRIVPKPFSFIFLLEGVLNYHFVWETLDTEEATYLWHIEKRTEVLKKEVGKLEGIIKLIRAEGKNAYIQSTADAYCRVYHDYSGTEYSFTLWRQELEGNLI